MLGDHSAETFAPLWAIVAQWQCYFYVTDGYGIPTEFAFLPGTAHEIRGLGVLPLNLPEASTVYRDKALKLSAKRIINVLIPLEFSITSKLHAS